MVGERRKQRPFKTDFASAGDAVDAPATVDVSTYVVQVMPPPVVNVARVTDHVMEHSKSHPRMLKSNATSHVWAFGAIAELLDNAQDEECGASHVCVDVFEASRNGIMCLSVQDDGVGMDRNKLLCMLSFGFSSKEYMVGNVGRFGIGFKSGSMRLAKDALILTKRDGYAHAALLSQSFLDEIEADDILIPMFSWKIERGAAGKPCYVADAPLDRTKWQENMRAIEVHTFVRNEMEMLQEISKIQGPHGTRIVLFNLRADELNFTAFKNDIRIAGMSAEDVDDIAAEPGNNTRRVLPANRVFQQTREGQLTSTDVPEDYSLRSYMEILYLRPRCAFTLRGTPIKFRDPIAYLKQEYYVFPEYRPRGARAGITLHMGYAEGQSKVCGFHIYNKNRLIKMYQRFGAQLQANTMMKDMLGVVEADALEPTHNKQAFKEADISYMKFKRHLTQSMNDYYFGIQQIRHAGKKGVSFQKRKYLKPKTKRSGETQMERRPRKAARESESDASDDHSIRELPRRRATRGIRTNATGRSAPLTRMKSIHHTLMTHKSSHVFLNPVDPQYWEIPDYFDVIKNPMDLGTIQARLDLNHYVNEDPDAYAADVRLVFANAMTYNKEGDAVYTMARTMSTLFENEWARRMDMNSLTSSDEEEDELSYDDVRESRKSKRQASEPKLRIDAAEQNDSAAPQPSAALVTVESVPHPLKCVLDESFFRVVEESIGKLEKELREERAKNAVSERTEGEPTPSSATQDTHHSRMFNNLVAENIGLKNEIKRLEGELEVHQKSQKIIKTTYETKLWKEYNQRKEEMKQQKAELTNAHAELAKANVVIEKLRNALPRRICADPSTLL